MLLTISVITYSCMMKEIRILIHKPMVQLNIYQTHGCGMQNKIYCK